MQAFADTLDYFSDGYESQECDYTPEEPQEYVEFDVDAAREAAILDFNNGF
jgi:hypothetical protein